MAIKRKRSTDNLESSPASHSSSDSSPQSHVEPQDSARTQEYLTDSWTGPRNTFPADWISSSQLNSRTRKRWRDNRPDIDSIHAQTIDKLYIGQRLHPEALHFDTNPPPPPPQVIAQAPQQKTSLHSFWNIRSTPASTQDITFSAVDQKETGLRCQGCDREVSQYSAGASETLDLDMDMNMNGVEEDALACRGCGKRVCDACAVQRCARVCLECATDGFG